jgi:hypothetical protein
METRKAVVKVGGDWTIVSAEVEYPAGFAGWLVDSVWENHLDAMGRLFEICEALRSRD